MLASVRVSSRPRTVPHVSACTPSSPGSHVTLLMHTLRFPDTLPLQPQHPQDDFKAMNILIPTHYVLIAKRCFKSMRDNDFKVRAGVPLW